ncbi:MAG TPA: hypothetical protein VNS61_14690 [Caldimonas sp.]|nr:hypothetical protein [Caldimonas sp.]
MRRVWAFVILVLAGLVFAAWASDFVTMQGERTIYTVECSDGAWKDDRCSGKLVAGNRYRYRALKPHHEVIFWTVGSKEPSGKFDECTITDGRNWVCKPGRDATRSITLEMAEGAPVPGPPDVTRPFRAVSKWRWILLDRGLASDGRILPAAAPASAG